MKPLDHHGLCDRAEELELGGEATYRPKTAVELQHVLDFLPQMVWANLGGDGGKEYYNRQWLEFTGVALAPDGSTRRTLIHPEDRERAVAAWEAARASGTPYEAAYRLRHRSGEYRWILSRGQPETDANGKVVAWYGTCTDVDDHVRDRTALQTSENVNRTVLSATTDSMKMLGADGCIRFLNDAARAELAGRGFPDAIGVGWLETFPAGARIDAGAAFRSALGGLTARFTNFRLNDDGDPEWREFVLAPVPGAGDGPVGVVVSSRDVTEARLAEERLRWAANHDPLTGLANRNHFRECLEEAIRQAACCEAAVGLIVLDLENLKQLNDALGHSAGDCVLNEFAMRLKGEVGPRDMVGRLAGDEFGILLTGQVTESEIAIVADKIQKALKAPFEYERTLVDCRARMGATLYPKLGGHADELLKQAHLALYAAKKAAGSDCPLFQSKMRAEMQNRASMISLCRHALEDGRVEAYYQPKVELGTGAVAGFEALFRWRDYRGRVHLPGTIAAAFDDRELAPAVTQRMVELVLSDLARWLDAGLSVGSVAINASAPDFRKGDFADLLLERMTRLSVPTSMVQLEVTEGVFIGRGAEYVAAALRQLSEAGVKIALDDFGTGFASLTHLKHFPVDILKIDQSFVRDLGRSGGDEAIVRGIINLSESLGLQTVAEGVERREQEEFLLSCGCDLAQGFLFGKAAPARDVPGILERGSLAVPGERRQIG